MAISAIHPAGPQAAASPEAQSHQRSIPMRFDFAAMLAAVDGPDASAGLLPASTNGATTERSALGAEAFRSSVFAGHIRLTTIVFSDGTSETRLDEMGADNISAPPPKPVPNFATPRVILGALSDLEPEIDAHTIPGTTRRKITGGRGRGTALHQSDGYTATATPRTLARITADCPGRLIDLFV
jgi:hypothetical protein